MLELLDTSKNNWHKLTSPYTSARAEQGATSSKSKLILHKSHLSEFVLEAHNGQARFSACARGYLLTKLNFPNVPSLDTTENGPS